MIHFTLLTFQMYSSSAKGTLESLNGMNDHKNVEGDQT